MESIFSNNDLAMEILSYLSIRDLSRFKCVSKRWKSLVSNPSFLHMHHQSQRSRGISGLFIQYQYEDKLTRNECFAFNCLGKEWYISTLVGTNICASTLVIMASCNGLICCRNRRCTKYFNSWDLEIFIFNPITMESITLRPPGCHFGDLFGLAFYPFGSSSSRSPSFKVVGIHRPKFDQSLYSFLIFSSETGKWRTSMEVCHCEYNLHENKHIFVNSRFYWLTENYHIIFFDIEQEVSGVIKLPGSVMRDGGQIRACLGDSDGYLHYVLADKSELLVWILRDHCKPDWVLKHRLNLDQFHDKNPKMDFLYLFFIRCHRSSFGDVILGTLTFYDEVLYMLLRGRLYSYDFRTGKLEDLTTFPGHPHPTFRTLPTTIPYFCSLAAMGVLKSKEILGNASTASCSTITQGRPERKLKKPKRSPQF